jgi:hypothetical protein
VHSLLDHVMCKLYKPNLYHDFISGVSSVFLVFCIFVVDDRLTIRLGSLQ